ncbi:MarR family winged helix-turn-helix transcriptional regulator [Actinotalea solisilvae]|uniref:MarR family winged helix-turn-helix transcriptional regulator n=1 Tax=Actinotalea solisilvae TaxID=2072922 RepID=UPI0027DB1FA4|nr:MarR family transcriptional regulator [Actinotalea solisilvae]
MEPAAETPDEVPWLTRQQQLEWRDLFTLLMTLPPALDLQLRRDAGLNLFEYHVLAGLSESPGRTLVLSDLAASARGSLSRLSHAVTRLERAGFVERRTLTDRGGRAVEARLTDAGFARLEEVAPGHVRAVRRLLVDPLTPEQLTALAAAARAITAATLAEPADDAAAPDAC